MQVTVVIVSVLLPEIEKGGGEGRPPRGWRVWTERFQIHAWIWGLVLWTMYARRKKKTETRGRREGGGQKPKNCDRKENKRCTKENLGDMSQPLRRLDIADLDTMREPWADPAIPHPIRPFVPRRPPTPTPLAPVHPLVKCLKILETPDAWSAEVGIHFSVVGR